jgi:hypothetical protein
MMNDEVADCNEVIDSDFHNSYLNLHLFPPGGYSGR